MGYDIEYIFEGKKNGKYEIFELIEQSGSYSGWCEKIHEILIKLSDSCGDNDIVNTISDYYDNKPK